jgi:formate dehydrogenase maturation protein FdhE
LFAAAATSTKAAIEESTQAVVAMDLAFWDKQINRANELAGHSAANDLLTFYASVLSAQRDIYQCLLKHGAVDVDVLSEAMPLLLKAIEETASPQLSSEMQTLKTSAPADISKMLLEYANHRSPTQFFAKALFQPYGRWCWENEVKPIGAKLPANERHCPACGGLPHLSVRVAGDSVDGGSRNLLCATCLYEWFYRRVACANCGEEAPAKLAYFKAEQFAHIKIEICETCRRYVKSVDLTELGNASGLVDDVASAALDLWAIDRGYTKLEINLVGL